MPVSLQEEIVSSLCSYHTKCLEKLRSYKHSVFCLQPLDRCSFCLPVSQQPQQMLSCHFINELRRLQRRTLLAIFPIKYLINLLSMLPLSTKNITRQYADAEIQSADAEKFLEGSYTSLQLHRRNYW